MTGLTYLELFGLIYTWVTGLTLTCLFVMQWVSEKRQTRNLCGIVELTFHRLFTVASICFIPGWSAIFFGPEHLGMYMIAVFLIDIVTTALVIALILFLYFMLLNTYAAIQIYLPRMVRACCVSLAVTTLIFCVVSDIMEAAMNRLWPRAFFLLWLAVCILLCAVILWFSACRLLWVMFRHASGDASTVRSSSSTGTLLRRFKIIIVGLSVFCLVGAATQIDEALGILDDFSTEPLTNLNEKDGMLFSVIMAVLQSIMLAYGLWYGWIPMMLCGSQSPVVHGTPRTPFRGERGSNTPGLLTPVDPMDGELEADYERLNYSPDIEGVFNGRKSPSVSHNTRVATAARYGDV